MRLAASDRWGGVDVGAVCFLVVLLLLSSVSPDGGAAADRPLDQLGAGLLAASFGLLAVGLRFPGTAAVLVLAVTAWWHRLGYGIQVVNVPTAIAFFLVGLTGTRATQWRLGAVSALVLLAAVGTSDHPWGALVDAGGWIVASMLLGEMARRRGRVLDSYSERVERAEAEREREAERRVTEERLRIARELHDLLAHTVAAMAVQAEVAVDALDRSPAADDTAEVRAAVRAIRAAGHDAMSEVRATVTVLRGDQGMDTAPAPGIGRIGELIDVARAAGLTVESELPAPGEPLPSLVELAAYRIVQEALTNVVRHADASLVQVRLAREHALLVVEVADDGAGIPEPAPQTGFGLRGMAERVAALGGSLRVGSGPAGGLAIRACLPVGRAVRSSG